MTFHSVKFYIKIPEKNFNWSAFMEPFSHGIWISILLTIVILSGAWVIFYRIYPNKKKCDGFNYQTLDFIFFSLFCLLCQKGKIIFIATVALIHLIIH